MSEKNIALKLTDVEFRRRKRVILTKVNLEINKGEKWVLFGPNGIGKSSLVQMMSTRGFPSEGTVDILGNRLGKVDVFSYRNRDHVAIMGRITGNEADAYADNVAGNDPAPGTIVYTGDLEHGFTSARLSEVFGLKLEVTHMNGRWNAYAL